MAEHRADIRTRSPQGTPLRTQRLGALLVAAAWFVLLAWCGWVVVKYAIICQQTVTYPFQLEWMEGGVIETIGRVLSGEPLYPEPSVDYVGYIYTPLYFWVCAGVAWIFGLDFGTARGVSLLAVIGVCALLYRWVRRETLSVRWGVVSVALFLATYEVSGFWLHLARVDALTLFLTLSGATLWAEGGRRRSAIAAGIAMAAAVLCKQSALLALGPFGLAALVVNWRRALWTGAVAGALLAMSVWALQSSSDGWFLYYVFQLPRRHATVETAWQDFWRWDLWRAALGLLAGSLGLCVVLGRSWRRGVLLAGLTLGLLCSAWVMRLHDGGWLNVLIPGLAAMALAAPMGLDAVERAFASQHGARAWLPATLGVLAMVAVQLFVLGYERAAALPAEDARSRGAAFLDYLEAAHGEVLIPDVRWVQTRAGQRSSGLGMAARDVLRSDEPDDVGREALLASLREAFAARRFSEVLLSEPGYLSDLLLPTYCKAWKVDGGALPVTGWRIVPVEAWIPRPDGETRAGRDCGVRDAPDYVRQAYVLPGLPPDLPPAPLGGLGNAVDVLRLQVLPEGELAPGGDVVMEWTYRVRERLPQGFGIFVHVDKAGYRFNGDHLPGGGRFPVHYWRPGDIVLDRHHVHVPRDAPRGEYQIWIGFYRGESRLPVSEGVDDGSSRLLAGTLRL